MKKKKQASLLLPRLFLWLLAVLLVTAIVHLVSILIMPSLATRNASARLAAVAEPNRLVMIDTNVLPFEDPASIMAVCRFDLSRAPLRLRGRLSGDVLVTLSFNTERGLNFYGLNERAAQRGRLDILLATREQIEDFEANEGDDEVPQELRLEAPVAQGFILLRAIAERASLMGEAKEALAGLTCKPD